MKLKNPPFTVNSRICSDHFLQADYQRDFRAELLGITPKHKLLPEAVPSVFDFSKYTNATVNAGGYRAHRPSPIGRAARLAKRDLNKTVKQVSKKIEEKKNI